MGGPQGRVKPQKDDLKKESFKKRPNFAFPPAVKIADNMETLQSLKHHRNYLASSLHFLKQASRTLALKQISGPE